MASDTPSASDDTPRNSAPRRAPPTIDLASSDVSGDTNEAADEKVTGSARGAWRERISVPHNEAVLPVIAAALGGMLATIAVVMLLWSSGMFGDTAATATRLDNAEKQVADLSAQIGGIETRAKAGAATNAGPVSAVAARLDTLEKLVTALRNDVTEAKRQNDAVTASLKELTTTTRSSQAADPQVLERLARLEGAVQGPATTVAADPAPNANLQRLMIATTLETAVRRNEPFASALAAAKQSTDRAVMLSPLDPFADKGIPTDAACLRDVRDVLKQIKTAAPPRAAPVADSPAPAGTGLLDRLQSGLSRLVKVERTDAPVATQAAPTAALEAALRNNDLAGIRRELSASAYAGQPQIQSWLQLMQARDTALAATRQFSADALAALAKSRQ